MMKQTLISAKYIFYTLCLVLLSGCIYRGEVVKSEQVAQRHDLVDKIWNVQTAAFIDEAQLFDRIAESKYLLLGEIHDNTRHHQLQADIIDNLYQQQRQASVSFEMISLQQGEMLKQHSYSTSAELIEILDQRKNNWPYARDYQIVFDSVLAAGFEILAANLDLDRLIKMTMQGDEFLPDDVRQLLNSTPFSEKHNADLENEIIEVHCNMLPATAIQPMTQAQRIRDAIMSLSMLNSHADHRVLIAGNGHTRSDRGVPLYLRKRDPHAKIVSIAFIDTEQGINDVDSYTQRWGGQGMPFDFVWFTEAVQRQQDPCDSLRQHGKHKQGDVQSMQKSLDSRVLAKVSNNKLLLL